jgi:hypothetical protein
VSALVQVSGTSLCIPASRFRTAAAQSQHIRDLMGSQPGEIARKKLAVIGTLRFRSLPYNQIQPAIRSLEELSQAAKLAVFRVSRVITTCADYR